MEEESNRMKIYVESREALGAFIDGTNERTYPETESVNFTDRRRNTHPDISLEEHEFQAINRKVRASNAQTDSNQVEL